MKKTAYGADHVNGNTNSDSGLKSNQKGASGVRKGFSHGLQWRLRRALAAFLLIFVCVISPALSAGSIASADDPVDPPPATNDTALEQALADAAAAKSDVRPSTDGKDVKPEHYWAPQAAFNALNASISAAKEVLGDPARTQEAVDNQVSALDAAIKTFNKELKYGTKSEEVTPAKEVVKEIFLKNDAPGKDGKRHFVGEDFDSKYKTLEIDAKGQTIQLNGYYTTNLSDGARYETDDNASPLGTINLNWKSSDPAVAQVSPNGLITPIKDGETTISATVAEESKYEGKAPAKSVKLKISGQTKEYVASVTVIDKDGKSLSEEGYTVIIDGQNKFFQFYALIKWHDPVTGKDRTEDTRKDKVTSTIKWSIGGSSSCGTVNGDTGRFKSSEFSGNCYVQCNVTGGKGGKTIKAVAKILVDTGKYEYNPADSLMIKVVYEKFPDKVVEKHTWKVNDLAKKLSSYTYNYTILGGSRYGVIRAKGYLFKDILVLGGVELDDVYQFRFSTADGYDNPITAKLLFGSGTRYYFPNWDVGGSRAGAEIVPPMLATESNMMWNESEANPHAPLDIGTRFRLVFGPLWSGATNSSHQIYFIKGITVVLKGAPPADNGKGSDDGKDSKNNKGDSDKKDDPENKGDDKTGTGKGTSGNTGSGNGTGTGAGNGGASGQKGNSGQGGGTAKSNDADLLAEGKEQKVSGNDLFGQSKFSSNNMKVFEMISNSKSNIAPLDMDLPYLPYATPVALGGMLAGALVFTIGYRRRLALV